MIHDRLRAETQRHHQDTEAVMQLMSPELRLEHYVQVLRRWKTVLSSLQEPIWGQPDWDASVEVPARLQKIRWIEEDLSHLAGDTEAAGTYDGLIPFDFSSALGAAYVLEGSTLGATVLKKHFSDRFGLSETKGLRFFTGYGDQTGARWKAFLQFLRERSQQNPAEDDKIIVAAQLTFTGITDSFRGHFAP